MADGARGLSATAEMSHTRARGISRRRFMGYLIAAPTLVAGGLGQPMAARAPQRVDPDVPSAARRPCMTAFLVTRTISGPGVMITIAATPMKMSRCAPIARVLQSGAPI